MHISSYIHIYAHLTLHGFACGHVVTCCHIGFGRVWEFATTPGTVAQRHEFHRYDDNHYDTGTTAESVVCWHRLVTMRLRLMRLRLMRLRLMLFSELIRSCVRPNIFFSICIRSSGQCSLRRSWKDLGRSADFLQHVRHCRKDLRPAFKPSEDEAPHAVQTAVTCQNQAFSTSLVLSAKSDICRSNWSNQT